jgi:hypothetical protein
VMAMDCMRRNETGTSSASSAASASSTSNKPKTICIHGLRPVNRGHATDGFCLVGCSVITSLGGLANPLYIYRQTCTTF